MIKIPTKKEKEFAQFLMDKLDRELKEIWEAYRMNQFNAERQEIEAAVKKIRGEYK